MKGEPDKGGSNSGDDGTPLLDGIAIVENVSGDSVI